MLNKYLTNNVIFFRCHLFHKIILVISTVFKLLRQGTEEEEEEEERIIYFFNSTGCTESKSTEIVSKTNQLGTKATRTYKSYWNKI